MILVEVTKVKFVDVKKLTKYLLKIFAVLFSSGLFIGFLLLGFYFLKIHSINQEYYSRNEAKAQVALRKFPYPFKAAMAISSDIDNTETLDEFREILKFLNTKEITSMGEGLGLKIGNSFFFYEPPESAISYFSKDPNVSEAIIRFIKAGYIDYLHSYGRKTYFTRQDAVKALDELKKNKCLLDVWIDHSVTTDNFGDHNTFGLGDHPESPAYHADLTLDYGIKFAWMGRATMITGQSTPFRLQSFTSIFDDTHPYYSFVNITKEFARSFLALLGNKKYAIHKKNELVKISTLDDGQKIYEFIRFNYHWQGVGKGGDSRGLAYILSKKRLENLKKSGGYMIVYTHLGRNSDCDQFICKETQRALRNLAEEYRVGNIFVTTTSNLLNYYINRKFLNWSYEVKNDETIIYINSVNDPIVGTFVPTIKNLEGMTFYVPDQKKATIYLNNKRVADVKTNSPDYTKKESITITDR